MDTEDPMWRSLAREAAAAEHPGDIIRLFRRAHNITLAQLGQRCGYSASALSRMERGRQQLRDITVLRAIGTALSIPPELLGLAPGRNTGRAGYLIFPESITLPPIVDHSGTEEGDDPVRRRELLAGLGAVTGAAAFGMTAPARSGTSLPSIPGLEDVLYGAGTADHAPPVPITRLRATVASARADFQAARYTRLGQQLPALLQGATATRDVADGPDREAAEVLLADAYIVASNFLTKLNDDDLAWITADRALRSAQDGSDPLTLADALRSVATVLRRIGRPAKARNLVLEAAADITPDGSAPPDQLSVYGNLLQVAAYTAAVDGDRDGARELIQEASAVADRVGAAANHRHTAFNATGVALYQVSIAQVLGDNGTAIEHATTVRPAAIPTAERRGRYWVDVARAFHQWGKHPQCYRALLSAERAAPAEVRYRPPVHRIVTDLMRTDRRRSLPGLGDFAKRIGAPT